MFPVDFELQVEDLRNKVQRTSTQNARLTNQNAQLSEELDKRNAEQGATRQVSWQMPSISIINFPLGPQGISSTGGGAQGGSKVSQA
jgi:hypothetical protein